MWKKHPVVPPVSSEVILATVFQQKASPDKRRRFLPQLRSPLYLARETANPKIATRPQTSVPLVRDQAGMGARAFLKGSYVFNLPFAVLRGKH